MKQITLRAREALATAHREALLEGSSTVKTRHLLIGLALLPIAESTAAHVLNGFSIHVEALRNIRQYDEAGKDELELSANLQKVLERATSKAQKRNEQVIASAHLLAGALQDSATIAILTDLKIQKEHLDRALGSLEVWVNES